MIEIEFVFNTFNLQILIIKFVIYAILEISTGHNCALKLPTATQAGTSATILRHSVNLPSTPNSEVKIVRYIYHEIIMDLYRWLLLRRLWDFSLS